MNSSDVNHAPVIIIGGGPVGMMLALFLDYHGVRSLIVNRDKETRLHPKGNTHNSRTMEHYRRVGIASAIRKLGLPSTYPRDITYFTRLNSWELVRFSMPSEKQRAVMARDDEITHQIPEPLLRVNQMYVERYMHDHLKKRENIKLRFGWHAVSLEQDDSGVNVIIEDSTHSSRRESWRADYLIGCDGSHSFVRKTLGICYQGTDTAIAGFLTGRMFSSHLRIPALHNRILRGKEAWMYNVMAPGLRMLLISLNGKDEFVLLSKPGTETEEPDDQKMIQHIQAGCGESVDVEIIAHSVWHGGLAQIAQRFSEERIHLAGDAIHLFSPTGGFGMNTGIDDASNLAWKLAAVIQGWAEPGLLSSYEIERMPVAKRNTAAARQLTQRASSLKIPDDIEIVDSLTAQRSRLEFGDALQVFRNQFSSPGIELGARYDHSPLVCSDGETPPLDDLDDYHPDSSPGGRLPHFWVQEAKGNRRSLFDLLGSGFSLLRIGVDAPEVGDLLRVANKRGIPLNVIELPTPDALALYRYRLLLIRPDQYICWRGNDHPENADALFSRVTGSKKSE